MSDNFLQNVSKYVPFLVLICLFYLLTPKDIILIKNVKITNNINVTLTLSNVMFFILLIYGIFIGLKGLKR